MADDSLARRIAEAAREMEGELDSGATMDTSVRLALELVPSAQEAGISLVHSGGEIDTPAATSGVVDRIDQLQYENDEGPCLSAIRTAETVQSSDVRHDERWPSWGPAAAEETGVRSMLCFRLFTHDDKYGALNLYSRQSGAFEAVDVEHGLALAAHSAIAIAAAQEIDQLKVAMDTRSLIGQAQGILMERYDLDSERAFSVLVRSSSLTNRKLRDIALELVRTRALPGQPRE